MAMRAEIVLDSEEREVLERWARRPKSAQALALRCRVVLAAAEGATSKEIASKLGCNANTVGKWRGRFARRGLDGDEPRPGKPRSISDRDVERVLVKTLEEQLAGIRPQAPLHGGVQALPRPAVHRQSQRCRRALPQPARDRGRALRRREVADPGTRSLGAGVAAHARCARAAHP